MKKITFIIALLWMATTNLMAVDPVFNNAPDTTVNAGTAYSYVPDVTDPDEGLPGNDKVSGGFPETGAYSITGTPSWASFNIDTGELSGATNAGNIGTYQNITITVTDFGLETATINFQIEVLAVDVVFTSKTVPSIFDDATNGDSVGTVTASGGSGLQFSEVDGPNIGLFQINDTTGEITVEGVKPFIGVIADPGYNYHIKVVNAEGGEDTATVFITVTPAPTPILTTVNFDLPENEVLDFQITDLENSRSGGNGPFEYSLDKPSTIFALSSGGLLTLIDPDAIDFEGVDGAHTLSFGVTITDFDSRTNGSQAVTINVTNVNEVTLAPDQTRVVNETVLGGNVGLPYIFTAEDHSGLSFTVTENQGQPIAIDGTGQLYIFSKFSTTVGEHLLSVLLTDNISGETAARNFLFIVEAGPNNLILDQETIAVSELHEVGPTTAKVVATTTGVTFAIEDNVYFTIDGNTGVLSVKEDADLDFEANEFIVLDVTASKAGIADDVAEVAIPVGDEPDTGTVGLDSTAYLFPENSSYGTVIDTLTFTATFPDNLEFESDSSVFAVNDDGELYVAFGAVLDFETLGIYIFDVTITDTISGANETRQITVLLIDWPEDGTTFIINQNFNIEEGLTVGPTGIFIVGAGENLEYTITGQTPADVFQINTTTGELILLEAGLAELDLGQNTSFQLDIEIVNTADDTSSTATIILDLKAEGSGLVPDYFFSPDSGPVPGRRKSSGGCIISTPSTYPLIFLIMGMFSLLLFTRKTKNI